MTVEIERIPLSGSELCSAYIQDFPSVDRFYAAGSPNDLASYRGVVDGIRATWSESRWEALAAAAPGTGREVRARLAEVVRGRGGFVATGQQAGLFLGPLYTVYKALTAAKLAERLEASLGIPVMPMFTVASEDHDWAEVNHTQMIDVENRLLRLAVAVPDVEDPQGPSPPVERITVPGSIEAVLAELIQATPNSEFKVAVLDPLRKAYRAGHSFAQAFQEALESLIGRFGFLVSRTAAPYVKRSTRQLLWSEWQRSRDSRARLLERNRELEEAGFAPQVAVDETVTNLFLDGELGRDRVVEGADGMHLRRSGQLVGGEDLQVMLEESPGRVSPGALLRPVTEARAFPVIAYVGGPAEISYLAQSQVLFELHEVAAPVVVPRNAFQLIEAKVAKVLDKYGISAADLSGDSRASINQLIDRRTPQGLREALGGLRRAAAAGLEEVEKAALQFDSGAKGTLGKGSKAVWQAIDALESKLQARVREKHEIMRQQLEKAPLNLYPEGRPQERMLNPYPYLVRYGEGLLDQLYAEVTTPVD